MPSRFLSLHYLRKDARQWNMWFRWKLVVHTLLKNLEKKPQWTETFSRSIHLAFTHGVSFIVWMGLCGPLQPWTIDNQKSLLSEPVTIDCRYKDRKTVGELWGDIGAIRWVITPSSRRPRSLPPKIEPKYQFLAGVCNCQIPNHVVKSQLFPPQEIKLTQTRAFCHHIPRWTSFRCWKANPGVKLSRNSLTPENGHLQNYSLCQS